MRVLVIDDNKEITEMLSLYFESQEIEYKAINDGREGLKAIETENYNFVLLDVAMPQFSGIDIVNSLKQKNVLESKNIVIFTASSETSNLIQEFKKLGIKDIVKKPLDMDDLSGLIEKFRDRF